MAAVAIISGAGPLGGDHRGAEGMLGCAARTKGGALAGLFLALEHEAAHALAIFFDAVLGDIKTQSGVEVRVGFF